MSDRGRAIGEEFAETEAQTQALNESLAARELVCPNCGSERIGTRERAEIWQRASFMLGEDGVLENAAGDKIDVIWEAYDSEDVGDTETVGYFCAECLGTWGEGNVLDGPGPTPFVTRDAVAAKREW